MLLFLAAIVSAFWYLRNEEIEREQESVKRDTEIAQQQLRLRLIENQEQLVRMAREHRQRASIDADEFRGQAAQLRARAARAAGTDLARRRARAARQLSATLFRAETHPPAPTPPRRCRRGAAAGEAETRLQRWRATLRQPVYSRPFADAYGTAVFQLHVPLIEQRRFAGALIAEYSIDGLLRYFVPPEVDAPPRDRRCSTTTAACSPARVTARCRGQRRRGRRRSCYEVPLAPAGNGLVLRGAGLPHLDRPDRQRAVLDGGGAVAR